MTGLKSRIGTMRQQSLSATATAAEDEHDEASGTAPEVKNTATPQDKLDAAVNPSPEAADPERKKDETAAAAAPAATAPVVETADPGTVAQLCADAGVPQLAKPLIDAKLPLADVKARIESAGAVRGLVAAAHRVNSAIDSKSAESYIATGASLTHVKADLFDKLIAAQSPEIRNSHDAGARPTGAANDQGWDAAFTKANPKKAV